MCCMLCTVCILHCPIRITYFTHNKHYTYDSPYTQVPSDIFGAVAPPPAVSSYMPLAAAPTGIDNHLPTFPTEAYTASVSVTNRDSVDTSEAHTGGGTSEDRGHDRSTYGSGAHPSVPAAPVPSPRVDAKIATTLPPGWEQVVAENGTYYYHTVTRVSRWDKPSEQVLPLSCPSIPLSLSPSASIPVLLFSPFTFSTPISRWQQHWRRV